jgi:hypothetical protein
MKIELDFIPVEEKLPIDDWMKEPWFEEGVSNIIGTFFGIVDNYDPNDDPEICIVDYLPEDGFVYHIDMSIKYDGKPWRVTHWAKMPNIKPVDNPLQKLIKITEAKEKT